MITETENGPIKDSYPRIQTAGHQCLVMEGHINIYALQ